MAAHHTVWGDIELRYAGETAKPVPKCMSKLPCMGCIVIPDSAVPSSSICACALGSGEGENMTFAANRISSILGDSGAIAPPWLHVCGVHGGLESPAGPRIAAAASIAAAVSSSIDWVASSIVVAVSLPAPEFSFSDGDNSTFVL